MINVLSFCSFDTISNILFMNAHAMAHRPHGHGWIWAKFGITHQICCTIVTTVAIIVVGFLLWKLMDHIAYCQTEKRNRQWKVEDIERKQKADLLEKKLIALKGKDSKEYSDAIDQALNTTHNSSDSQ